MEDIRISIIVPVFNSELYVAQCIESLICQSLRQIEIILVDDGSTDNSGKICDEYARKDLRIRVIHQKNAGQSCARNKGLSNANGEYVLFVDSDDWIREDACEILYNASQKYECDIVHGDCLNDKDRIEHDASFRKCVADYSVVTCEEYLEDVLNNRGYDIILVLNLIKREFLIRNKLSFHEGLFYEDQEYALKLFTSQANGKIVKIRFPYYFYRIHPNSTTTYTTIRKVNDILSICESMYEWVKTCEGNESINCSRRKIVAICYYHVCRTLADLEKSSIKEGIRVLKKYQELRKVGFFWEAPNLLIKCQNFVFSLFPTATVKLLHMRKRRARTEW